MENFKGKLVSAGSFLALVGVLSIGLYFVGYNLRILLWVDMWGENVGWLIRIGATVVGVILFVVGKMGTSKEASTEIDAQEEE